MMNFDDVAKCASISIFDFWQVLRLSKVINKKDALIKACEDSHKINFDDIFNKAVKGEYEDAEQGVCS